MRMRICPKRSSISGLVFSGRHWFLLPGLVVCGLVACGGGGGGGGTGTGPFPESFNFVVSPTSISIEPGGQATVTITATGYNGFSAPINIQASGLPAGVTPSPSTLSVTPGTIVTPGTPQNWTFSASASAATTSTSVALAGTSGQLSFNASLGMSIVVPVTSNTPPFRMRYVRTGSATQYFLYGNINWLHFDPGTSRFFVADADSNSVFVLDSKTETLVGTLAIPGAYGIDETPDNKTLYVGTEVGDVYTIDPVSMTITQRYPAASIGEYGFTAMTAIVLASGQLALMGAPNGPPPALGGVGVYIWDPATNSLTPLLYPEIATGDPRPCGPIGPIDAMTHSPDRTRLIVDSNLDGVLCVLNPSTGSAVSLDIGTNYLNYTTTPDGKYIVIPRYSSPGSAIVLNAQTLAQVSAFNVLGDTSAAAGFYVSADSKTLYTPSDSIVYAYNLSTGEQIGWFPNIWVCPITGGEVYAPIDNPLIEGEDGTGLFAGPLEEGVGFLDPSMIRTGPVGTLFQNSFLNPPTGGVAGGIETSWGVYAEFNVVTSSDLSDIYFGSQKATGISVVATGSGNFQATTPPGAPGPADVYTQVADGGIQYLPYGFSYGPTVVEITPNSVSAASGGASTLYGFGLGPPNSASIPSGLSITVGGSPVTITAYSSDPYNVAPQPLPLEGVSFQVPGGTAGTSANVVVTTSAGSTTVKNGITYVAADPQSSSGGMVLAQGVYDPRRDLYYFSDASRIRVYSKRDKSWLVPISFPAVLTPKRLRGLALSPDGSLLAVADLTGQAIYVLSPDNPSGARKFNLAPPGKGISLSPTAVAISDLGVVYFTAVNANASGMVNKFFKLDTTSGRISTYPVQTPATKNDIYLRAILSSDSSQVYFNDTGNVFNVDTTTDTINAATVRATPDDGDDDLSLAGNQAQFAASGYFYDSSLNAEAFIGMNLQEKKNVSYLYGEKLSPDGTLLFQPTTNGIDVLDARLGKLLKRIALPFTLSPNYDALVADGSDSVLVAITGARGDGIAVIDLSSLPPAPFLPYEAEARARILRAAPTPASSANSSNVLVQPEKPKQRKPPGHNIPHVAVQGLLQR